MLDRDMKAAVKSVLGTSASVGILVENENPNDLMQAVDEGKFDSESVRFPQKTHCSIELVNQ